MKILFDLSGCDQLYKSNSIYSLRILSGFKENGYKNISLICNAQISTYVQQEFPEYNCHIITIDTKRNLKSITLNYLKWRKNVKNISHDILFIPHLFPPYFCFFSHSKTVLAFHDLQGLKIYSGLRLWICRFFYPLALLKCRAVITISDFVKKEAIKTYPFIPSKKYHTIYNGIVVNQVSKKADVLPIKGKYLLYVSSLMEHKNVITLLKAFNLLKDDIPHTLVIIGKVTDVWKSKAIPFIKQQNLESRILHIMQPVSNELLAQYYMHADLFIHPSLMEGFGYTPIEAAIYGTPVLTNKETALYETTLGLLNYYEPPSDANAMASKIKYLLTNPISTDKLSKISNALSIQYNNLSQSKKIYNLLKTLFPRSN